jgi:aminopeptidase N
MPALSGDPGTRDRFFEGLKDAKNRTHEPWAADGLYYIGHPLRAHESEKYVRPGLELLREIQRTGDIFFPGDWMAALVGGRNSPQSAATVRQFLEEQKDYPIRLRRTILQSADMLFRASGILAR